MPDLEEAEKGAEWAPGKLPGKQPKNSRTGCQTAEKQLFCMLLVFVRLFFGCFPGTLPGAHLAPFSAFFRLLSRSGVQGLSSWSGRLHSLCAFFFPDDAWGTFKKGASKQWGKDICMATGSTGMTVRCRTDCKRRHSTGKRLSRAIWSCFIWEQNKHIKKKNT